MVEARDIIARALCRDNASGICSEDCTGFDKPYCVAAVSHGEDADTAIAALTAAGWTLAPPGSRVVPEGGDAETVERCAREAEGWQKAASAAMGGQVIPRLIAAAIRDLAEAKP